MSLCPGPFSSDRSLFCISRQFAALISPETYRSSRRAAEFYRKYKCRLTIGILSSPTPVPFSIPVSQETPVESPADERWNVSENSVVRIAAHLHVHGAARYMSGDTPSVTRVILLKSHLSRAKIYNYPSNVPWIVLYGPRYLSRGALPRDSS